MSMFQLGSNCSDCKHCTCHYFNCCLAGHGDDDFSRLTKEQFDKLMEKEDLKQYLREELIEYFPEYIDKPFDQMEK